MYQLIVSYLVAFSSVGLALTYPDVRRNETVSDYYFGTKIADPYRWLENLDSAETKQFVEQQQRFTDDYLDRIPSREKIRERLTELWNYEKFSAPEKCGKYYISTENSGLQSQNIIYVRDSLNGPKRVLLDPSTLSKDGTASVGSFEPSKDGETIAYSVSDSGSDWKTVHFRHLQNLTDTEDILSDIKFPSISWSGDNKGIFYMRYLRKSRGDEVTNNNKVFYHKLGTSQQQDNLVAEFPDFPNRLISVSVSESGDYLIIKGHDTNSACTIHMADLTNGIDQTLRQRIFPVFSDPYEALYSYIANEGSTFIFKSNKDAPNSKLIKFKVNPNYQQTSDAVNASDSSGFNTVSTLPTFLEEHPTKVIQWAVSFNTDKLIVCYIENVKHQLEIRRLNDASLFQKVQLEAGTVSSFYVEKKDSTELFFMLKNFASPGKVFHCQFNGSFECKVLKEAKVKNTDLGEILTEQIFYPSKDGTLVPMYVVRRKGTPLDGSAPTLLYGYGGFNQNIMPAFITSAILLIENFRGIYVSANIRGGGELGQKWHTGSQFLNRHKVLEDFQAAAEYLIRNNYTRASKLAIHGISNGGMVVAASVNQRPELFGAAIAQVGVMDMLRFQHFTVGYTWCMEYGCSNNKTHFEKLLTYSPLHNIRLPPNGSVQYPAVLVATADHDDRVVPSHSFKYLAELQHTIGRSPRQTNPLLLYVQTRAGHGAGKPTSKQIDELTDIYAFIATNLGLEFHTVKHSSR